MRPGNKLGDYIQFGSVLDLTATGIWRLDRDLVDQVYATSPRTGFPSDLRPVADRMQAPTARLRRLR